jgi:hypothetical protein
MNHTYFIRHGKGQDNVARKFSSTWMDHPRTEYRSSSNLPSNPRRKRFIIPCAWLKQ